MANPQLEDGFLMLAIEILDRIMKTAFSGSQFRIVMCVWRFTYGFKRKAHELSVSFVAEATDLHPVSAKREISNLIEMDVLTVMGQKNSNSPRVIAFNKDYDKWRVGDLPEGGSRLTPSEGADQLPPEGADRLPKKDKIKYNSKERSNSLSRNKKKPYSEDDRYYQMAVYFHSKISSHAAANGKAHLIANADLQKWADEFRKIIEIDKRDKKELQSIIDWCTADPFWQLNILSPKKLREKYTDLGFRMSATRKQENRQQTRDERNKDFLKRRMEEARKRDSGRSDEANGVDLHSLPPGGMDR